MVRGNENNQVTKLARIAMAPFGTVRKHATQVGADWTRKV